ncbi:MAG TPA: hypothetical protein VHA79_14980 [Mycobacteriales bacterium]|jgi:hypothetical protein|nr:hypothetical protein [Mycobacteriales bacterium]HVX70987.1 hypothetical protein [Mycobacteriales bacterium]
MRPSRTVFAITAAATGALIATSGAPALGASHAKSARATPPLLSVTMSKGAGMKVTGPRTFSAGRLSLTLVAKKGEQEFAIMRLHKGYTLAHLKSDFATYGQAEDNPTPAALKALNRIVRRTTFFGGLDSGSGHTTVSGSVVLPKAGTYYLLDDANGPGQGGKLALHVTAKSENRIAPEPAAHVIAVNAKRFRGSVDLPASGTIEFTNKASNSPHFLFLMHVKKGTTRKQAIKGVQSPPGKGPNIFRDGAVGTDVLHMGKSQTITYTLPAGDYAEVCFFPDLETGMPHAFMGMVRIVHLS